MINPVTEHKLTLNIGTSHPKISTGRKLKLSTCHIEIHELAGKRVGI